MDPRDVLALLASAIELEEKVVVDDDGEAKVRVFYPDDLYLRRRPSGIWSAMWRTGQVSQWRHEASTPWAALAQVVESRLRWGWGYQSDLATLRRLQAAIAQHIAREQAP